MTQISIKVTSLNSTVNNMVNLELERVTWLMNENEYIDKWKLNMTKKK